MTASLLVALGDTVPLSWVQGVARPVVSLDLLRDWEVLGIPGESGQSSQG